MASTISLDSFTVGEQAGVANSLDKNFLAIQNAINTINAFLNLSAGGSPGNGIATGTASVIGRAFLQGQGIGAAFGSTGVIAFSQPFVNFSSVASTSGAAVANFLCNTTSLTVASTTGSSNAQSFIGNTSVGTGSGGTTISYVGSNGTRSVGTGSGSTTATAATTLKSSGAASTTGTSTATATATQGPTESPAGTVIAQPATQMIASNTPGQSSTGFNTFAITANPGTVIFNGVNDTTQTTTVQLYYTGHFVYLQNSAGNWFTWASSGVWNTAANPLPATPTESVEGLDYKAANQIIYANSAADGTAALSTATVGNGLDTWAITANPGQLIHNGAIDVNTSGVTQIVYHNHQMWQFGGGAWYIWTKTGPANGYTFAGTGVTPFVTTPAINVARTANQQTNAPFTVSGVYQDAAAIPTLQYQNNGTGTWLTPSSSANVTIDNFSFIHEPVASVSSNYTVSVRDANQTGVLGTSNVFSIFTPGVTTLTGITVAGLASGGTLTTVGGQPAGTVVGQITVATSPGTFSGTIAVSGTNASSFTVNASYQLVTAAVLNAGSNSITLTASQTGASGSPQTASYTVAVSAEAANGTSVTTVGPTITGSVTPGTAGSTLKWALVAATAPATGNQITVSTNGAATVLQTASNAVTQLYYINHTLYQFGGGAWYAYTPASNNGNQLGFISVSSPIPVITITNIEQGTGLTGDDGQISVVGTGGVATDSFIPPPGTSQLFKIQMFVAGTALSFAAGPSAYAISGGAQAGQFTVSTDGTAWYLNSSGALPAGTYAVNLTATY